MDLNDLKKTWDKLGSEKQLDENQLQNMLRTRTKSLIERIERNIRIGFIVLIFLIVLFILNDFILSPLLVKNIDSEIHLPLWLQIFSVFGDTLIVLTFLFFVFRYRKVKKTCEETCDLRHTLIKTISTLQLYKTLFFISIFTILISISTNFIAGIYEGVLINAHQQGIPFNEIEADNLVSILILAGFILFFITFGVFLLFRWGFRRLYGNYIQELKLTLRELEEIND